MGYAHTVAVSGLAGWNFTVHRVLSEHGFDCEILTRGNLIIVYDTTSALVAQFLSDQGYGGGTLTEVD